MSEESRKRVLKWINAIVIGLPVFYVAMFGPACWITSSVANNGDFVSVIYKPILGRLFVRSRPISRGMKWYAELFSRPEWALLYSTQDGTGYWTKRDAPASN